MSAAVTSRARWIVGALLLVALVAVLAVLGGRSPDDAPLSPTSTGPQGAKALVDLLDELGAEVDVAEDPPAAGEATTVLVLADTIDRQARRDLHEWVRAGGTAVVTDADSPLLSDAVEDLTMLAMGAAMAPDCDVPALAGIERVAAPGSRVYEAGDDAVACFPGADGHWLVASAEGEGVLVALGGPQAFLNRRLDQHDNAVLAVALLAPDPGEAAVTVLSPGQPGGGQATLGALVSEHVVFAIVQLALAFLVVVAWRARRLGRPVDEPQAVRLAGSELVAAVGGLLQQTRSRQQAAALLRDDVRRWLAERLGLPVEADVRTVAERVAARVDDDAEDLAELLAGAEPDDDTALVTLAQQLTDLREQVSPPAPTADAGGTRVR